MLADERSSRASSGWLSKKRGKRLLWRGGPGRFSELEEEAWSPVGFAGKKKNFLRYGFCRLIDVFLAVISLPYLLLLFEYSFAWGG